MAQGCNLIYSGDDKNHFNYGDRPLRDDEAARAAALRDLGLSPDKTANQIVAVRHGLLNIDKATAAAQGVYQKHLDCFETRSSKLNASDRRTLIEILASQTGSQADLLTGLGNPMLRDDMALALPGAINDILRHTPDAAGLFGHAGAHASSIVSNLKNSGVGKADGVAYEPLMTRKMLNSTIVSGGHKLHIGNTDRIDFGPKLQASYGGRGKTLAGTDGWKSEAYHQPYRYRVEADLMITRPDMFGSNYLIGVDFKHTRGTARVSGSQLQGVKIALETGEVSEFHFVSNSVFDNNTIRTVDEINAALPENVEKIRLYTNCGWE